MTELHRALQRIVEMSRLSAKLCLFIDGLDEFEGDHIDYCRALQGLCKSRDIKICAASRPWNVFEDFLGQEASKKLYMHELTRNDIRLYAETRLQEHPRWKILNISSDAAEGLIEEITRRSAGVFLWVYLVIKQLRGGLTEYDSFSDLRRRLENIPLELGIFFKQILESVDPFYHDKMATTLQMAAAASQPAQAMLYDFHNSEYENHDYALKITLKPLNKREARIRKIRVSRQISGRCRGLLEVNPRSGCVEFLHRTVMDYLNTPEMVGYLASKAPLWANPDLSLLRAYTARIKTTKFPEFVDRTGFAQFVKSRFIFNLEECQRTASGLAASWSPAI